MTWKLGSYTIPAGDYPSILSQVPEDQEDTYVEYNPVGATASDSTIIQHTGTPSKGADGSSPFRLVFPHASAATLADLRGKKRTTFTLEDGDGNTYSVYLKRLTTVRAAGFQDTKFRCVADLLGR